MRKVFMALCKACRYVGATILCFCSLNIIDLHVCYVVMSRHKQHRRGGYIFFYIKHLSDFNNKKVLHFTSMYQNMLNRFLSEENGDDEAIERYHFLKSEIRIIPGHWGGWHIVTHPEVNFIKLEPGLDSATVFYRTYYEGGNAAFKLENNNWIMKNAGLTWIE